ncbi:MAG: NAD(P)-dependent oxidoreductase [Marivita sp.]|uniref:NAD(P)-dependent oxidoreductase n=1 Tax=Marivita sp. TaxID=2003365 RepID=UPI003EF62BB3
MKIGFIGLGLMGRAMVECLQKAEYDVVVLGNRDRTGIEAALARGATEATSARDLTKMTDIVMLCVGTSDHVEANVYGDNGILAGVSAGQVVIDFGTSLPASTLKIGAEMEAKGASYLDAPLGRTPAHAVDGLLNLMCSGDKAAFDQVKPVLDVLGENVFHLGKLGSGHTIKLINNYFGMTTACAMSEAFATADAAGIDRQALFEVMAAGPLRSGMMEFIRNYAVDGDLNLAFSIANASKDVGYYRQMTQDLGLESRMSGCADDALKTATKDGDGDKMVSEMVDWMSKNLRTS